MLYGEGRCHVCGGHVRRGFGIEYGWEGQYGEGQALVHYGRCEKVMVCELLEALRLDNPDADGRHEQRAG